MQLHKSVAARANKNTSSILLPSDYTPEELKRDRELMNKCGAYEPEGGRYYATGYADSNGNPTFRNDKGRHWTLNGKVESAKLPETARGQGLNMEITTLRPIKTLYQLSEVGPGLLSFRKFLTKLE